MQVSANYPITEKQLLYKKRAQWWFTRVVSSLITAQLLDNTAPSNVQGFGRSSLGKFHFISCTFAFLRNCWPTETYCAQVKPIGHTLFSANRSLWWCREGNFELVIVFGPFTVDHDDHCARIFAGMSPLKLKWFHVLVDWKCADGKCNTFSAIDVFSNVFSFIWVPFQLVAMCWKQSTSRQFFYSIDWNQTFTQQGFLCDLTVNTFGILFFFIPVHWHFPDIYVLCTHPALDVSISLLVICKKQFRFVITDRHTFCCCLFI